MKSIIDRFEAGKRPRILVIGDIMIDHYIWGKCSRISPEAPVQVIDVEKETTLLGGSGNVINNVVAFGADAEVISVIGDDKSGKVIVDLLNHLNLKTFLITEQKRKTTIKTRLIASHQQVVRFDQEENTDISEDSQIDVINYLIRNINNCDIVLLSDYSKGMLPKDLTIRIIEIARHNNKKVLVDPKGPDFSKYFGAYLLKANLLEAMEATGINIMDDDSLTTAIKMLKNELDLELSLITLGERGIAYYDNELVIEAAVVKETIDVTGAGDTVLAALGVSLCVGCTIRDAVSFANKAASIVVGKLGSATVTVEDIVTLDHSKNSYAKNKVFEIDELKEIVLSLKRKGKKIVFTNGCFDILHVGHLIYLQKARGFGDVLIVGMNSDISVKINKGSTRPINNQVDRAAILSALEYIDYVVIFESTTPLDLVKELRPDVLVKGGDYKDKHVIGQEFVEEVKIVDYVEGKSSSDLIDRKSRYENDNQK